MVRLPPGLSKFEFVVLASLRAGQLSRGCTPRVEGAHKRIVIAQLEVACGLVVRAPNDVVRERTDTRSEASALIEPLSLALSV